MSPQSGSVLSLAGLVLAIASVVLKAMWFDSALGPFLLVVGLGLVIVGLLFVCMDRTGPDSRL